jgi:hypothetical protein
VLETLLGLVDVTWRKLEQEHQFAERFGVQSDALLRDVRVKLGLPGLEEIR